MSWLWFDFVPTASFGFGSSLVIAAVFLYNRKVTSGADAASQKLPYAQIK
jgi:drug/metabolite transporter (DMT)-like permease